MLAVLGDPIAHSVSPQVHTRGLRELDLDAVYVAVRCADLAGFAQQLAPQWRGLALTAPLKLQAARLASECSTLVTQAGAANTWVRRADGAWHAHNTDGIGLERAVQRLWPRGRHTRITVLGTGGAARTAVWALHGMNLEEPVRVWGRRTAEAQVLAAEAGASAWSSTDIIESDLLIDCTSAALRGEVPLSSAQYAGTPHVMASTYRPLDTPLLRAARARGCATSDGRWWFLEQACAQFELQQGVPAPRAAMEAQLQAALESAAQSDVEAWS
jgi:shikimate dehydrogenase